MALSQVQIIQSLGEALSWFERELAWGTNPAELNHLTGRIGELYAAMITRGQMASSVNQQGYDVVSAEGQRLSVKTITSSNHVAFNQNTLDRVDRILVLRILIDEGEVSIEELLDTCPQDARIKMRESNGKLRISVSTMAQPAAPAREPATQTFVNTNGFKVAVLETGKIRVTNEGQIVQPSKPVLRDLAAKYGVDLLNGSGNPKNTRQLGADVVRAISELTT